MTVDRDWKVSNWGKYTVSCDVAPSWYLPPPARNIIEFKCITDCHGTKRIVLVALLLITKASFGNVEPDPYWVREALRRHNEYRRGFGSPPLTLNEKLCKSSLAYARELAGTGILEHSSLGYGENILAASGKVLIYGSDPVDAWYDEIENYNFTTHLIDLDSATEVGSFAQVVWKDTREMCISYAAGEPDKDGIQTLFVVAHYLPRGNEVGRGIDNVTPLLSSPYFYNNSDSAPNQKHLSYPIGSDGKPIIEPDEDVQDHGCWKNNEFDAEKVTTPLDFIESTLEYINEIRKKHSAPPFPKATESCQVCKSAQGMADRLANSNSSACLKALISQNLCGELITQSQQFMYPEDLINKWYAVAQVYEYYHQRTMDGSPDGEFVRLLWKGAEKMCVAFAKNVQKNEYVYVGMIYSEPKPNFDDFGARKENVQNFASKLLPPCLILLSPLAILSLQIAF